MKSHNQNTRTICVILTLLAAGPVVQAYPPDPNNAALLYYQAFISLPKDQDQVQDLVEGLPDGADPNDQIREYLKLCQPAIRLAVAASEVPACDWGLRYSQGYQMSLTHLSQMRALARLMKGEVAVLVADGQYRQALERCLTLRQMGQHISDQNIISFLVGVAINALAEKAIQNTLSAMPPDIQTLVWLKGELAASPARRVEIKNGLKTEEEVILTKLTTDRGHLLEAVTGSTGAVPSELVEHLKNADEAFFEGSRRYFKAHMDAVVAVLNSPVPYLQRHDQLEQLDKRPGSDSKQNLHAVLTASLMPSVAKLLTLDTRARSNDNLLKAAIEIYLVKARTGSIPDQLPPGMPKDPFNGQDFKYEKTPEGFTLTRWTDDPAKDKNFQRTFKVKVR